MHKYMSIFYAYVHIICMNIQYIYDYAYMLIERQYNKVTHCLL